MKTRSRSGRAGGLLAAVVLALAPTPAQGRVAVPVDPYTGGDAALMQAAGYTSFGPFPFGAAHTSTGVETLLGDEPLLWVETAHFRLGCAVSELALRGADREWLDQVKGELVRLRDKLPKVPKSPRVLDPWLRTHLIAQRLEDCYAGLLADLGLTDAAFPSAPQDAGGPPEGYYGAGPYLGMAQKFSVLIVKRGASLARYTRAHAGGETTEPFRFDAASYGGLAFVVAEESSEGKMANDHALHTQLVYNVIVNLINGYRGYGHETPPWLVFGLAHWHSRRISPRYPAYEKKIDGEKENSPFWQWDERARGLLKFEAFESVAELMARERIGEFGMEEHIQAWFLADFLMSARKAQTMRLLHDLKAPFHKRYRLPTHAELLARQAEALAAAFGVDAAGLEQQWREWAQQSKRRK